MATQFTLPRQVKINVAGRPYAGAQAFFYQTGTETPQLVYQDSELSVPHAQPVLADDDGYFPVIWLDPDAGFDYRVRILSASGTQLDDVQNVPGRIISVSQIVEDVTHNLDTLKLQQAEIDAEVTPVNYAYPPMCVNRYGTNTTPGTTSMRAAWQAAIDVAKECGGEITWDATAGPHLIDGALDCTIPVGGTNKGFTFRGTGHIGAYTIPPSDFAPDVILRHTGHAFDCTGTLGVFFENLSITTDSTTYPDVAFLLARNTDGRSMQCRFRNVMFIGKCSKAVYYLYGSEESVWEGCQTFNRATDANAKCFILTQNNIRSLTSTFTTIATGGLSSLGYNFYGCSTLMFSNTATADCFELENANFGQMFGGWAGCANGTGGGRSLVHVNTTNGCASGWSFYSLQAEASAPTPPSYGVHFGNQHAASAFGGSDWNFISCKFPHATAIIGGGQADLTIANLVMVNLSSEGVGTGGVNITGTLNTPFDLGVEGTITATTITTPNFKRLNNWQQNAGETSHTYWDSNAATNEKGYRVRVVAGQFLVSLLDDSGSIATNTITADRNGSTPTALLFNSARYNFNGIPGSYADDAAAAAGGVSVGDLYRNGSVVQVRVA